MYNVLYECKVNKQKNRKEEITMITYNNLTPLILENVNKYYTYEQDFYRKRYIKFPPNNWMKFKNGVTPLETMRSLRVSEMINDLFTPYEQMLITLAQIEYSISNIKMEMNFLTFFNIYKKRELNKWLSEQSEKVVGEISWHYDADGNQEKRFLKISIDGTKMSMNFMPTKAEKIPAGRQNRLEWIKENVEFLK